MDYQRQILKKYDYMAKLVKTVRKTVVVICLVLRTYDLPPLAQLANLTALDLHINKIRDLSPPALVYHLVSNLNL